jgi:hypothetical protein
MSDTVDNVMNTVSEADEPADVVVEETPVEEEAPVEETPVEEEAPVEEAPVASASETEAAEPAPVAEEVAEPEPVTEEVAEPTPSEPVSTQEVVQNVQEILSSTETNVTVDNSELEERVRALELTVNLLVEKLSNKERIPTSLASHLLPAGVVPGALH